ncbi:hypothetical protein BGZ68_003151 [Mortierella alpina]|nr:hypothetical protein BGZ68_003151 [Mortierella alpina]
MFRLCQSLRGRYFAWTGAIGEVSIWDLEKGKSISTTFIPKDAKCVDASLSEDGSLLAISLAGAVQVHDVVSGIDLGVRKVEQKDTEFERIIRRDYLKALGAPLSMMLNNKYGARSILRVHDTKMVKAHSGFWQNGADFSSTWDAILSHCQGATLNIKRLRNILSLTEDNCCSPYTACELQCTPFDQHVKTGMGFLKYSTEIAFNVQADYVYSLNSYFKELMITNGRVQATISLGPAARDYLRFFMDVSSQVVLVTNGFLQVWQLPSTAGQQYELVHVEAFVEVPERHANDSCITEILSVQACTHGRRFRVLLELIRWIRDSNRDEVMDELDGKNSQMFTFPRIVDDTFSTSEKYRYENGIASLLDTYAGSDPVLQRAIVRFLIKHIRPSSKKHVSSLVILCRSWKHRNRSNFEEVITRLLPTTQITWIPDINTKNDKDPLSILLKIASTHSSVIGTFKIIMDYCVKHARGPNNLSFLTPFLRNLQNIMFLFPDEARIYLGKMAFVTVDESWRDYVIENNIVSHSPWRSIQFWKTPLSRDQSKDQVMQLYVPTEQPRVGVKWREYFAEKRVAFSIWQFSRFGMTMLSIDKIKALTRQLRVPPKQPHTRTVTSSRPIFVAAFDALWHFKDIDDCKEEDLGAATIREELTTMQDLTLKQEEMVKEVQRIEFEMMKKKPATKQESITLTAAPGQETLINVAFQKSDDAWRLIESRLHYIELAENLSYHIPGFRQTYDWFPKEIYFYDTAQKIEEFEEMLRASVGEGKDLLKNDPAMKDLKAKVENLESQLALQQEQAKQHFEELKKHFLDRAEGGTNRDESTQHIITAV